MNCIEDQIDELYACDKEARLGKQIPDIEVLDIKLMKSKQEKKKCFPENIYFMKDLRELRIILLRKRVE